MSPGAPAAEEELVAEEEEECPGNTQPYAFHTIPHITKIIGIKSVPKNK